MWDISYSCLFFHLPPLLGSLALQLILPSSLFPSAGMLFPSVHPSSILGCAARPTITAVGRAHAQKQSAPGPVRYHRVDVSRLFIRILPHRTILHYCRVLVRVLDQSTQAAGHKGENFEKEPSHSFVARRRGSASKSPTTPTSTDDTALYPHQTWVMKYRTQRCRTRRSTVQRLPLARTVPH